MPVRNIPLSVADVAKRLVTLCEQNQFLEAQQQLYDPMIERVETDGSRITGLENCRNREMQFLAGLRSIRTQISHLAIIDSFFSLVMTVEFTVAATGEVRTMQEIGLYKVRNGKIVFEQFFR